MASGPFASWLCGWHRRIDHIPLKNWIACPPLITRQRVPERPPIHSWRRLRVHALRRASDWGGAQRPLRRPLWNIPAPADPPPCAAKMRSSSCMIIAEVLMKLACRIGYSKLCSSSLNNSQTKKKQSCNSQTIADLWGCLMKRANHWIQIICMQKGVLD